MLLAFLMFVAITLSITAIAQPNTNSTTIKLINLYDAFGAEMAGLKQDFGFSCLIEYKGKTILFDAGTNAEIFRQISKVFILIPIQ
ncbi:hypothetical protein [Pontibacter saemangeumensis]